MMRAEPNISILYAELPFIRRPSAAAAAGFAAAEMWWPFDRPEPSASQLEVVAGAFEDASLQLALLNFDGGDIGAGDRGLVSDPARVDRFRANVEATVALADRLGCKVLHALYGNAVDGLHPQAQRELAIENLSIASRAAGRMGARVVVEALNLEDNPRYGLRGQDDAIRLIDEVSRSSGSEIGLLFDTYHAQRAGEDPVQTVARYATRIGHVQVADAPGRNEPGTGVIDFPGILGALAACGYDGWIGLEFIPSLDTATALRRLRRSEFGRIMGGQAE